MSVVGLSRRESIRRRLPALSLALAAATALQIGCAHERQEPRVALSTVKPDLGALLDRLATAYDTLDADAILSFYEPEIYSLSWDLPYAFDTGNRSHRETLGQFLDEVAEIHVAFSPDTRVDRLGDRAWSTRYFRANGKLANDNTFEIAGWHSAVWVLRNSLWLIEYEHFQAGGEETPPPIVAAVKPPPPADILKDIFFDWDKWNIRKDQVATITANAEWLLAHPDVDVLIEGHCDERATNAYNIDLGRKRAESTRDFLVAKGVSPNRMRIVSIGEERPFDTGRGEPHWGRNRRSHFVITKY